MNEKEIKEYFYVNKNSLISLKQQLIDQLEMFLVRVPLGTRLPSERSLAEDLQISRLTVRAALKKFLDEGSLISCGRNGTITGSRPKLAQLNPIILGLPDPPHEIEELTFLSFEELPHQKKFWEKVVELYHNQKPVCRIRLELTHLNDYLEKYRNCENFDILHVISKCEEPQSILQELPQAMMHPAKDKPFFNPCFPADTAWNYLVPMELSHMMLLWNRELADSCGFASLKSELEKRGVFGLIRKAHELLPDQYRIGGHVWDLFAHSFTPKDKELPKSFSAYLKSLAELPESERIFFTSQRYSFDMVENFWRGNQLFTSIDPIFLSIMGPLHFQTEKIPYPLPLGQTYFNAPVNIGISKACKDPKAAQNFIEFLLSPQIQNMLPDMKNHLPVRTELLLQAVGTFYKDMKHSEKKAFCNLLRAPRGRERIIYYWMNFAIYHARQEIVNVLQHKLSYEEADCSIRQEWRLYVESLWEKKILKRDFP